MDSKLLVHLTSHSRMYIDCANNYIDCANNNMSKQCIDVIYLYFIKVQ